jgi:hypothetical protein
VARNAPGNTASPTYIPCASGSFGSPKQILPLLSYLTTSDVAFANAHVSVFSSPASSVHFDYVGTNRLFINPSAFTLNYCVTWTLVMESTSPNLPLCLDNFFMLGWEWMNNKITAVNLVENTLSGLTNPQPLPLGNLPFLSDITNQSSLCADYSGSGPLGFEMVFDSTETIQLQIKIVNLYI